MNCTIINICFLEIMCEAPEIPNAKIIGIQRQNYRMSASVQYHCLFRPELSIQITCGPEGKWRGIQACTGKSQHVGNFIESYIYI